MDSPKVKEMKDRIFILKRLISDEKVPVDIATDVLDDLCKKRDDLIKSEIYNSIVKTIDETMERDRVRLEILRTDRVRLSENQFKLECGLWDYTKLCEACYNHRGYVLKKNEDFMQFLGLLLPISNLDPFVVNTITDYAAWISTTENGIDYDFKKNPSYSDSH